MMPRHHPDPEELLSYSAGSTPEWLSLVIACHLTYCSKCRRELELCEDIGGSLLDALGSESAGGGDIEAVLRSPRGDTPEARQAMTMPDARLPRPLARYFADAKPRWRFLAPGVRHMPLTLSVGGSTLKVVQFRPGYVIPEHSHRGGETLVIFHGSIDDSRTGNEFGRGDLCRSEIGSAHVQHVSADEPCIALVVNEAPLVPKSLWGRILKRLAGV